MKKILSDFFLKMIMAYRNIDDLQILKFGNLNEKMCFGIFPFLIYKRLWYFKYFIVFQILDLQFHSVLPPAKMSIQLNQSVSNSDVYQIVLENNEWGNVVTEPTLKFCERKGSFNNLDS